VTFVTLEYHLLTIQYLSLTFIDVHQVLLVLIE